MANSFVLDPRSAPFPTTLRPFRGLDDAPTTYPYFIDVRGDALEEEHPVTADLANLTLPWASPLELHPTGGARIEVLAHSSERSRITGSYDVYPNASRSVTEAPSLPLAVALSGPLTSHFAGRDAPLEESATTRSLDASVETARVVVVSSSDLVSDLILSLSEEDGGLAHQNNLVFLSNLLDWAGQDEELLAIRAAGVRNATLPALENEAQRALKRRVWLPSLLALLLIALLPQLAFRLQRPSRRLAPRDKHGHAPGGVP
jgi:ABC-2 type transport system permease protein